MAGSASAWERYLTVPGLVLNTIVALTLLGAKLNHWAASSRFADMVENDRTTVGIITQLISQMLGMILVTALCKYHTTGFKR